MVEFTVRRLWKLVLLSKLPAAKFGKSRDFKISRAVNLNFDMISFGTSCVFQAFGLQVRKTDYLQVCTSATSNGHFSIFRKRRQQAQKEPGGDIAGLVLGGPRMGLVMG